MTYQHATLQATLHALPPPPQGVTPWYHGPDLAFFVNAASPGELCARLRAQAQAALGWRGGALGELTVKYNVQTTAELVAGVPAKWLAAAPANLARFPIEKHDADGLGAFLRVLRPADVAKAQARAREIWRKMRLVVTTLRYARGAATPGFAGVVFQALLRTLQVLCRAAAFVKRLPTLPSVPPWVPRRP